MIKKLLSFLCAALFVGCIESLADNKVIVASVTADHPNAREIWTKAQGEAWQKKYGPIIGVNHPAGGYGNMPRRECLRKMKSLGFNSVRIFLGGGTASSYISNVESWASDCAAEGLTLSPVVTIGSSLINNENQTSALATLESYIRTVMSHFRNDDRIILWDLWNEPAMNSSTQTPVIMEWIKKMAQWAREEGCTQPLTSSIIWDGAISAASATGTLYTARYAAEAEMDIHNYHSYGCSEDHNRETKVMVDRLKKIRDVPIVNTECLGRVTGSTMARNLVEFARYHVNFYVWGLYACDSNWEVKWNRSTYYAYEPMFHNVLFADGTPYDAKELPWVKNFKFVDEDSIIDPGAAYTDRWDERRAWKWMSRRPTRGLYYESVADALTGIAAHASDGLYNSVAVKLNIMDYRSSSSTFKTNLTNLLKAADDAGMNVLPILASGTDITSNPLYLLREYEYTVIGWFYSDRRVMGWNLYQQTSATNASTLQSRAADLMTYVRYSFPNQPLFMTPLVTSSTVPASDSTLTDVPNLLWNISDVISYNTSSNAPLSKAFADSLQTVFNRPLFLPQTSRLASYFSERHVNWYATSEPATANVKNFDYKLDDKLPAANGERWPAWKAWAWMNRGETKGYFYNSLSAALSGIDALGQAGVYNSIRVFFDYAVYVQDKEAFYNKVDTLMQKAERYGLTVLPALFMDKSTSVGSTVLCDYVKEVVGRYAQNKNILAWDLYYRPGATNTSSPTVLSLINNVFAAARSVHPLQPLFMTPAVAVKSVPSDYISETTHSNSHGALGWSLLSFATGSPQATVYQIWCQSDVIGFMTSQKYAYMGMLQLVAYRFARPLFCTEWRYTTTEEPSEQLTSYSDMHTNWYVSRTIPDDVVKDFKFRPVSTGH